MHTMEDVNKQTIRNSYNKASNSHCQIQVSHLYWLRFNYVIIIVRIKEIFIVIVIVMAVIANVEVEVCSK